MGLDVTGMTGIELAVGERMDQDLGFFAGHC
jgi:hypothetical protein